MSTVHFEPGDRYLYRSATQGYLVLWVRGDDGLWTASDEEQTARGRAADVEIDLGAGDWILARGDVLGELLATAIAAAQPKGASRK